MNKKLVRGVGINDAGYVVRVRECTEERYPNGAKKSKLVWGCPYYGRWIDMLRRCYSKKFHEKKPTYLGCTVCKEWLTFSSFREWMITQDWKGKELDKDLLFEGNKMYSPETCVFVSREANVFVVTRGKSRGKYLIGCYWNKSKKKFQALCCNPFTKKQEYLGLFDTELEAHLAWKKRKHELSCELTNSEYVTDERAALALRNKYENYTILEDHIK